jgi:hypothetical protein
MLDIVDRTDGGRVRVSPLAEAMPAERRTGARVVSPKTKILKISGGGSIA